MAETSTKARKNSKQVTKSYERTAAENAFMKDYNDRKTPKRNLPTITRDMSEDFSESTINIALKKDDVELGHALLLDEFGTTDNRFFEGLISQIVEVGGKNFDHMLSIVTGLKPQDQMEAMLAAQMAAVHMQTMTFARRMNNVDTIPQQDSAERAFTKLARTFTTQMEALNRYRGKGHQKMTVEHVHVHDGGQAIVGTVEGGRNAKN